MGTNDLCNCTLARNFLHVNTDIGLSDEPRGLNPKDIYEYYNYISICKGEGKTIALIDAYYYANARKDLEKFSEEFNLPKPQLEIVYPQGQTLEVNNDWLMESALDLQYAHAMAPKAKLMLVSAKNPGDGNLYEAVRYAVEHGADIVSMSWATGEVSSEVNIEKYFSNTKVTFLACAGDHGGKTVFPSAAVNVISVGGTEILRNEEGKLYKEIAWSNGGGGPSKYITIPEWQRKFGIENLYGKYRTTPDVAFDASPASGVSVFITFANETIGKWYVIGGTSLATPSWAGIIASMNIEKYAKKNNLARVLYKIAGETSYKNEYGAFHDITEGKAGEYEATEGYDLITGLGTPNIEKLSCALERN